MTRRRAVAAEPVVAVPVLVRVVTTAGGRCECTGSRCHGAKDARCAHEAPAWRLTAAPRDPSVPLSTAWRVSVDQLAAWCGPCLDRAQRLAARTRAAASPATGDLLHLVDDDAVRVEPDTTVQPPSDPATGSAA